MKNSVVLKIILGIAGIMFTGVGIFSTFNPIAFVARNRVDISTQITLLNDYRGTGGVLLGAWIIILLGVFLEKVRFTSTLLVAVLYTTFALGRFVSVIADGMPTETLMKATVVELVVGLAGIFALIKFREN